jgi:hypothetical protein
MSKRMTEAEKQRKEFEKEILRLWDKTDLLYSLVLGAYDLAVQRRAVANLEEFLRRPSHG